ncbi:MAG: class I SAM-dependent methyltransferase [Desulfovibrionales bacterium]
MGQGRIGDGIGKPPPGKTSGGNLFARELFAPIASDYEIWSRAVSLGQDPLWRRKMVQGLDLPAGSLVLDVAAGTGQVTRMLERSGFRAMAVDQSLEMLRIATRKGVATVNARAETLPFQHESFDGLTFTYLLRYVDDPLECMKELVRVLRPGGRIGMVEYGRPRGPWGSLWWMYTRIGLPMTGTVISPEWSRVGLFLGGSIDAFYREYPGESLRILWKEAGLNSVSTGRPSFGGGLIMWGTKNDPVIP